MMSLTPTGLISLYHHGLGFSITPLESGGKRPSQDWKKLQERRPTDREVAEWWPADDPLKHNVGVICGKVSGGLTILDFEDEVAYRQFVDPEKIQAETMVVKTPHGGRHIYLRELGDVPRRSIRVCENPPLDILGSGGYAAAPPSYIDHAKCDGCGITGTTAYEIISTTLQIKELDGVLASTMTRCRALGWTAREDSDRIDLKEALHGVGEGKRNESAFRYARHLLFFVGLDQNTALFELQRWNQRNKPPLSDEELMQTLRSSSNYPSAGFRCILCGMTFPTRKKLSDHSTSVHGGR